MVSNQKFSSEQIIDALKAVNGMVYLAARKLGCEPITIYRRAKQVQAVQQAIEDSRGELVDIAEQKLRAAVLDREPWAVALVVKTLGKSRGYVERQEHTGADGEPMQHRVTLDLAAMTERELDDLERRTDPNLQPSRDPS